MVVKGNGLSHLFRLCTVRVGWSLGDPSESHTLGRAWWLGSQGKWGGREAKKVALWQVNMGWQCIPAITDFIESEQRVVETRPSRRGRPKWTRSRRTNNNMVGRRHGMTPKLKHPILIETPTPDHQEPVQRCDYARVCRVVACGMPNGPWAW